MLLAANPIGYPDWAVTVSFYAALHYVNHYFKRVKSKIPSNHAIRSSWLKADSKLSSIQFEYETLRSVCDQGRYYCNRATPSKAQKLFSQDLQSIKVASL